MNNDNENYVAYHVHSDLSLLDSVTKFEDYVDRAVELGQTAIAFSEHGKPLNWVSKKLYCDSKGIKYLHAVEIYVTEHLQPKVRDNMHCILIAKNYDGVKEINRAVSLSTDDEHMYYKNRLSIDELISLSKNVIITSACLAGPLNKLSVDNPKYIELIKRFDYLEIQPHNCEEQKQYNVHLAQLSQEYNKPLIAGTDAHSLNAYKAECRSILQKSKHLSYENEDSFDLTYKSYDELIAAFATQDAIPEHLWREAIRNTTVMANTVESFKLDISFKYPILYGSPDTDSRKFREVVETKFEQKLKNGIIPEQQRQGFETAIDEELRVFEKIGMSGFMLSMSELVSWCRQHSIPTGFARGSVAGSRTAYVSDIIDVNPEQWNTVFSRFCNEDRVESGDIDTDVIETDRPKIFDYIINRFGVDKTARVASYGTNKDLGTIDDIGRALKFIWNEEHGLPEVKPGADENKDNPYNLKAVDKIKKEYALDPEATSKRYPDIFYYFDGIVNTRVSQSVHPAGMVISPITLDDNYGVFNKDGMSCLMLDMEGAHAVGLVKYDFLVLGNIKIIQDACNYAKIPYPRSDLMDWNDANVWKDMLKSPVGIFQMESDFAFTLLRKFKPQTIEEMSLLTACIRPSGTSYRDELIARRTHKNPSEMIDRLLEDNNGYLVYQEDQIKFLQQICGFSGSKADTIRRAIGKKDADKIKSALPEILDGYCAKSDKPRSQAEAEAQDFLTVLEDSAAYSFGYNHSISYCLLGYVCAYLRYYHPIEFITSYLNNAATQEDISKGSELAHEYGIKVVQPKFGISKEDYEYDSADNVIAKGLGSIKYFNKRVGRELYTLAHSAHFTRFTDILFGLKKTSIDARQLDILIKIDFFSEFGNTVELTRINGMFNKMKCGEIKQVKKEGLDDDTLKLVSKYGKGTNDKGKELKSFVIFDPVGLVRALEDYIVSLNIKDVTIKTKIANQLDLLGAVNVTTNNPEDRKKLYVEQLFPITSNGNLWCYRIDVMSIGTGKRSRLTLRTPVFSINPITKGQIIYCDDIYKNNRGYWEMTKYHIIQ